MAGDYNFPETERVMSPLEREMKEQQAMNFAEHGRRYLYEREQFFRMQVALDSRIPYDIAHELPSIWPDLAKVEVVGSSKEHTLPLRRDELPTSPNPQATGVYLAAKEISRVTREELYSQAAMEEPIETLSWSRDRKVDCLDFAKYQESLVMFVMWLLGLYENDRHPETIDKAHELSLWLLRRAHCTRNNSIGLIDCRSSSSGVCICTWCTQVETYVLLEQALRRVLRVHVKSFLAGREHERSLRGCLLQTACAIRESSSILSHYGHDPNVVHGAALTEIVLILKALDGPSKRPSRAFTKSMSTPVTTQGWTYLGDPLDISLLMPN